MQEQKKKLVIASDGAAWIKDQSKIANCNKVFVYDLDKKITTEEDSACNLSKELALDIGLSSLQWK